MRVINYLRNLNLYRDLDTLKKRPMTIQFQILRSEFKAIKTCFQFEAKNCPDIKKEGDMGEDVRRRVTWARRLQRYSW